MTAPKLIKPVLKSSLSINRFHLCYAVFWNEHKKNTVGAIDASCAFPVTAKIYQPLVASAFRCTRERFWATHVRAFSPLLRRQFARKYWQKPLPENSKCPLPVDAPRSKTSFLKLPNNFWYSWYKKTHNMSKAFNSHRTFRYTNMVAFSLFCCTKMAAKSSCENDLYHG